MAERALTARSPLSERAPEVIRLLKEAYPNATVALKFSNPKTRAVRGACRMIVEEFEGRVPDSIAGLVKLPGVARKTANIVLGNAYPEKLLTDPDVGVAVDTHVRRVSQRLGFTDQKDPNKIERDLMAILPREDWFGFTYVLIDHGRAICKAPTPHCEECPVNHLCPSSRV